VLAWDEVVRPVRRSVRAMKRNRKVRWLRLAVGSATAVEKSERESGMDCGGVGDGRRFCHYFCRGG